MCNAGCTCNVLAMWILFGSWNCHWFPSRLWVLTTNFELLYHHSYPNTNQPPCEFPLLIMLFRKLSYQRVDTIVFILLEFEIRNSTYKDYLCHVSSQWEISNTAPHAQDWSLGFAGLDICKVPKIGRGLHQNGARICSHTILKYGRAKSTQKLAQ